MRIILLTGVLITLFVAPLRAQSEEKVINYQTIADEPYGIKHLWVHVQPITADIFSTNSALCYGVQAEYFLKNKVRFEGRVRGAWGQPFDFSREQAARNGGVFVNEELSLTLLNRWSRFTRMELGATYHVIDKAKKGTAKIVLVHKKREKYKYERADRITVNAQVRNTVGARGGFAFYETTAFLSPTLLGQDVTLPGSDGSTLRHTVNNGNSLFTNVTSPGFYVGGSYGIIRNVSVKADRFGQLGNDRIFTVYADALISPWLSLEDLEARVPDTEQTVTYSMENIDVRKWGFRVGFDMMFNQKSYFSFGGEMGLRPAIVGRAFYTELKVGLPVFGFRFEQQRTANNTGGF
ncbi:MAG: hypothetical protein WBA12_10445 [Catalinimonas sp.]